MPKNKTKIIEDPYLAWCKQNYERLLKHPNRFVVVDIKKNEILFGADSHEELSKEYRKIPRQQRNGLYKTHTFKPPKI